MQKALTVAEYAAYILNDPRVSQLLDSIALSNKTADQLLATASKIEEKADSSASYITFYKMALINTKRESMLAIVDRGPFARLRLLSENTKDIAYRKKGGVDKGLTYEDLPLVMFWHFLSDADFQPYLLEGKLAWFPAPLPSDRERQFVMALFLWYKMDSHIDAKNRVQYYSRATQMPSKLFYTAEEYEKLSSISARRSFIELFGQYVHTDVWTADDYSLRNKQGIVIRLRLSTQDTGLVVVQACGRKATDCNDLYQVNEASLKVLARLFLEERSEKKLTKSSGAEFKCSVCGCGDIGTLFTALHENTGLKYGLYCGDDCYNKK